MLEMESHSSPRPLGYVLKDHNRRGDHASRDRDSNRCRPPTNSNSKSHSPSKPRKTNHTTSSNSRRQARVLDRWATQQARETICGRKNGELDIRNSNYRNCSREGSPSPSDSSVSSLVQKWRELENQNEGSSGASSVLVSRANSIISDQENDSINSCWEPAEERLRVVDIIKKLPFAQCRPGGCSTASMPRIRGRQAVQDLFAKQERDRYSEIHTTSNHKAVSKFPKRGFLQTMLKLRNLRLEVSARDSASSSNKSQPKNKSNLEETTTSSPQQRDQVKIVVVDTTNAPEELVPQRTALLKEEHAQPQITYSSNVVLPDEAVNCHSLQTNNTLSRVVWAAEAQMINYQEEGEEEGYDNCDFCGSNLDWINDVSRPRSHWDSIRQAWYQEMFTSSSNNEIRQLIERGSVSNVLASDFPDKMDRIMTSSSAQRQAKPLGYEEEEDESRFPVVFPCSQMQPLSIHQDEEQQGRQGLQEHHYVQEPITCTVEERREESEQQFLGDKDVVQNEEEVNRMPESSTSHQYNNGAYYEKQAQVSSPSDLPWTNYDNQEDSDNSEQSESTPHQEQSSITNSFDQETQEGSSCKNNSSIEMELIYDLRTHMEQMNSEISELRKSVNNCVDMQAKLQSSIKDEVSVALGSKKVKDKESNGKVPNKGCCFICCEKKVDSVLYRCGHMCACFKCAHELQWSSGKCPICRAQIVDVVRVYTDDDV